MVLTLSVLLLAACAAPQASMRPVLSNGAGQSTIRTDAYRQQLHTVRDQLRETEAQLHLARQRAHALEAALDRLEGGCATHDESTQEPAQDRIAAVSAESPAAVSTGPRPLLRLYGRPQSARTRPAMNTDVAVLPGPSAPALVSAPPPARPGRLPVVAGAANRRVPAIPAQPVTVSAAVPAAATGGRDSSVAPSGSSAVAQYQQALRDLTARRFEAALAGFRAFRTSHAEHPYADNALYWEAEISYVRRQYTEALGVFEQLLTRYPDGNKVPDALLRMADCHRHTGENARADRLLERLRRDYPRSMAARTASQEGAS